jgi:hypothetical protein
MAAAETVMADGRKDTLRTPEQEVGSVRSVPDSDETVPLSDYLASLSPTEQVKIRVTKMMREIPDEAIDFGDIMTSWANRFNDDQTDVHKLEREFNALMTQSGDLRREAKRHGVVNHVKEALEHYKMFQKHVKLAGNGSRKIEDERLQKYVRNKRARKSLEEEHERLKRGGWI